MASARRDPQLSKQVKLVEEEVLGRELLTLDSVNRGPSKVDMPSRRGYLSSWRPEHTIMRPDEGSLRRSGCSVDEQPLHLKPPIRKRRLEHVEEAEHLFTAGYHAAWRGEFSGRRPRLRVTIASIERLDVLQDHVSRAGHSAISFATEGREAGTYNFVRRPGGASRLRFAEREGVPPRLSPLEPSSRALAKPATQRPESDRENRGDHYQQNRGVGQVGLRLRAVDLMRDQDRPAEDRARNESAPSTRCYSQVVEARPDTADDTERREDEVGDLRDAEEVPGQGPVQSRESDGEQYLDRARLLEEQRRQSHAAAILCAVRRSGGTRRDGG